MSLLLLWMLRLNGPGVICDQQLISGEADLVWETPQCVCSWHVTMFNINLPWVRWPDSRLAVAFCVLNSFPGSRVSGPSVSGTPVLPFHCVSSKHWFAPFLVSYLLKSCKCFISEAFIWLILESFHISSTAASLLSWLFWTLTCLCGILEGVLITSLYVTQANITNTQYLMVTSMSCSCYRRRERRLRDSCRWSVS